ncbi:hypothetical protein CPC08DRAFT_823169 [Agrocybe pediades]|nr:hypothetical protein CPC08DRAFT_823169 [Agrocybe pediades]
MSSPHQFPIPVSVQRAYISADLNSTFLLQYLFGVYTAVFGVGIYVYLHKEHPRSKQNRILMASMTVLYSLTTLLVAINWYYTNNIFGKLKEGTTRMTIFIHMVTGALPVAMRLLNNIGQSAGFLLADGLLVWRCFKACGSSLRSCVIPLGLFIVEIALVISSTTFACIIMSAKPGFENAHRDRIADRLSGATLISTVATSASATFLICFQIWRLTPKGSRARRRYSYIIDALVQSSAMYTAAVIFQAVMSFLITGETMSSLKFDNVDDYAISLAITATGLAPTLMVARLAPSTFREESDGSFDATLPPDLSHKSDTQAVPKVVPHKEGQQAAEDRREEHFEIKEMARNTQESSC